MRHDAMSSSVQLLSHSCSCTALNPNSVTESLNNRCYSTITFLCVFAVAYVFHAYSSFYVKVVMHYSGSCSKTVACALLLEGFAAGVFEQFIMFSHHHLRVTPCLLISTSFRRVSFRFIFIF